MSIRIALGVALLGAGVVAGLLVGRASGRNEGSAGRGSAPPDESSGNRGNTSRSLSELAGVVALKRVAALEQKFGSTMFSADDGGADAQPNAGNRPKRTLAEYRHAIDAEFESEATDANWAEPTGASLSADLKSLKILHDGGAEIGVVDCRTTMCRATISLSKEEGIMKDAKEVARYVYERNCATKVFLPDEGQGPPYRLTVFFDCAGLRKAGGVSKDVEP